MSNVNVEACLSNIYIVVVVVVYSNRCFEMCVQMPNGYICTKHISALKEEKASFPFIHPSMQTKKEKN